MKESAKYRLRRPSARIICVESKEVICHISASDGPETTPTMATINTIVAGGGREGLAKKEKRIRVDFF